MGVIASLFNFGKQTQIKEQINYNGIQENELIEFLNNFKNQISVNNEKLQASIEKSIEKILISKVKLIIAEIYKEHCESRSPDEKLVLSLDQIKSKADNMTSDVQKVITDLQDTKNAAREIKSKLNESREPVEAEIKSLNRICEDILYWSHRTHALCEKLFEKITITEDGQEKLTTLFTQYINAAELRHKEILTVIEKSSGNNADIMHTSLDTSILAEMFTAIKEINKKQTNNEDIKSYISQKVDEVKNLNVKMQSDIDEIRKGTDEGLKKADEILGQLCSLSKSVKNIEKNVDNIQNDILIIRVAIEGLEKRRASYENDINGNNGKSELSEENKKKSNEVIAKLNEVIAKLNEKLNAKEKELKKLKASGDHTSLPCPFCKTIEDRLVIYGHCECSVCGHRFENISVDLKDKSNDQILEDLKPWMGEEDQWRKDHHAILEQVSENIGDDKYNLYRMKLEKDTVSNAGALIIPFKTHNGTDVSKIAFCQPNTYDEKSKERLSKVKTLIFEAGLERELSKAFNGDFPFSVEQIPNLEKVLIWHEDECGYKEDSDILKKLKELKQEDKANAQG